MAYVLSHVVSRWLEWFMFICAEVASLFALDGCLLFSVLQSPPRCLTLGLYPDSLCRTAQPTAQCLFNQLHSVCATNCTVSVQPTAQCLFDQLHSVCATNCTVSVQPTAQCLFNQLHSVCSTNCTVSVHTHMYSPAPSTCLL